MSRHRIRAAVIQGCTDRFNLQFGEIMCAAWDPAKILVRPLSVNDAADAAELSGQLGYSVSTAELQLRIEAVARSTDRVALAAIMNSQLVGWIDASIE